MLEALLWSLESMVCKVPSGSLKVCAERSQFASGFDSLIEEGNVRLRLQDLHYIWQLHWNLAMFNFLLSHWWLMDASSKLKNWLELLAVAAEWDLLEYWNKYFSHTVILAKPKPMEQISFSRSWLPWPFADRTLQFAAKVYDLLSVSQAVNNKIASTAACVTRKTSGMEGATNETRSQQSDMARPQASSNDIEPGLLITFASVTDAALASVCQKDGTGTGIGTGTGTACTDETLVPKHGTGLAKARGGTPSVGEEMLQNSSRNSEIDAEACISDAASLKQKLRQLCSSADMDTDKVAGTFRTALESENATALKMQLHQLSLNADALKGEAGGKFGKAQDDCPPELGEKGRKPSTRVDVEKDKDAEKSNACVRAILSSSAMFLQPLPSASVGGNRRTRATMLVQINPQMISPPQWLIKFILTRVSPKVHQMIGSMLTQILRDEKHPLTLRMRGPSPNPLYKPLQARLAAYCPASPSVTQQTQ